MNTPTNPRARACRSLSADSAKTGFDRPVRRTRWLRGLWRAAGLAAVVMLAGCASTSVSLQPTPQAPVCNASAAGLVLWAPQWRADQKDVPAREEAAAAGLRAFFGQSRCFAPVELRRVKDLSPATVQAVLGERRDPVAAVVGIEIRELGPIVKLLSSAALIEGGTEVVLRVSEFAPQSGAALRQFAAHWQNSGPGVVKGVASLPDDLQAALRAALQAGAGAR